MPRPLAPDDLYRLRIPTDPRALARRRARRVVTLQTVAPGQRRLPPRDLARRRPTASAAPRQLTLGASTTATPRFSPDGRTLAFLSDRRLRSRRSPTRRRHEGARGRRPGPPALARRRRGAPADRPATGRRRASSGRPTGRSSSSRRLASARPARTTARRAGKSRSASPADPPAVGLPLHRPARLHVQRRGLHLRPGRPPLDRRRRDRRGDAA